jgi:hypothetical protein
MMKRKSKKQLEESPYKSFVIGDEETLTTNMGDRIVREEVLDVAYNYKQEILSLKSKDSKIHVDEIASGVAQFYEKVRKIIDWKDDNVLRRGAIERILKRRLFPKIVLRSFKESDSPELAKTMIEELIRGGHLPNHAVPQSRIQSVSNALGKYLYFLEYTVKSFGITDVKKGNNITTFIIEIAACEIEEILVRPVKEYGIIDAMSKILYERIKVIPEDRLSPDLVLDMIRVSVQRRLYHLDDNYIIHMYLRRKFPDWSSFSKEELQWFAENIGSIKEESEEYINSKVCKKFDEVVEEVDTVFLLLDDVFEGLRESSESVEKSIQDGNFLLSLIEDNYKKRRISLKRRLRNSAIFSTLSVLISNFATFYLLEIPIARLFYEEFNTLATIVDFVLPAVVMFMLIIFIKPPDDENLTRVLSATEDLLFTGSDFESYEVKIDDDSSKLGKFFAQIFYILLSISLFCGIGYVFYIAQLPMTSVVYDTFMVAITFYAALTVRKKSKELDVGAHRNFGDLLFDIFTVPLAKIGGFLSSKWREYNVVAIFTNYLVEIPFVAVLDFIELWSKFMKERKSEIS